VCGEARFLLVVDGSDGGGGDERSGRVEIRYSRPPDKADDLIRRIVEDQVDRVQRLTVVTSDLEVARHARAMGADVALADLFLSSMLGPGRSEVGEKPTTLTKKDLEQWAEIFRTRGTTPTPTDDGDE
jgi:predicted RNA-binding protein with PIN domain